MERHDLKITLSTRGSRLIWLVALAIVGLTGPVGESVADLEAIQRRANDASLTGEPPVLPSTRSDGVPSGLPLSFEPNRGQTDPRVRFLSRGGGYRLLLTRSEAILAVRESSAIHAGPSGWALLRMGFAGANPSPTVTGTDALPGKVNCRFCLRSRDRNCPSRRYQSWNRGPVVIGELR